MSYFSVVFQAISFYQIILTHSKSRVVLQAMKEAAENNKIFEVYVTSSSPNCSGYVCIIFTIENISFNTCKWVVNYILVFIIFKREEMCKSLTKLGISCTIILDSAVGYVMEQVDMVMVGAEGVAESGGVINKVCTI